MIVLYIAAILVALMLILIFMPVSLVLDYNEEFGFSVRVFGIKVAPRKEKKKAIKKTEDKPKKTSLKNRIKRDGISETLKKGAEFLKGALTRVKKLLPHIRVRDLRIKISVSGNDAALTAIEYGAVCAAFYPFLSWLCSVLNIKAKQIDVISSFENNESYVHFHTKLCSSAIWLFIAAYGVYKEYTKLTEEQSNERK
jgi:hypothetical protein